jgi:hypothetical protein
MEPTIIQALEHKELFGKPFPNLESWKSWIVLLKAIFNLEMTPDEFMIYKKATQRETVPKRLKELFVIAGRRSGKSRIASLLASYVGAFKDYSPYLAPGEKAVILTVAADRAQARTVFNYTSGIFASIPILNNLIENETADQISLRNNVNIEIHAASYRSLRGYSVLLFIADETCFWRSEESLNPDLEVFTSIRGSMGTLPDSLIVSLSSAYSRRGIVWQAYSKYFAKEDPRILIWVGSTELMNPSFDKSVIAAAFEQDPVSAESEYNSTFRKDIEDYANFETVMSVIAPNRKELPPISSISSYVAFADPSGGSSDSMTLGIAHKRDGMVELDLLREKRAPFSPLSTVEEFSQILKSYKISSVTGDRYGGEFVKEPFRRNGIEYKICEKDKSTIYRDFLSLLNSGRVTLLDDKRIIGQLMNLERRTGRTKDVFDHAPGTSDDVVNSVCGACLLADEGEAVPGLFFCGGRVGVERDRGNPVNQNLEKAGIGWSKASIDKFFKGD